MPHLSNATDRASIRRLGPWLVSGAILCGALLTPSTASADGGVPHAVSILVQPGTHQRIVLNSDYWGLMYSNDAGQTWDWTCAEAYNTSSLQASRLPMVMTKTGRVILSPGFGIEYTDDFCSWTKSADISEPNTTSFALYGDDVLAVTSENDLDAGFKSGLYRSTDSGAHWAEFGARLPNDLFADGLGLAPSDPNRIYVTASNAEASVLERSDDAGKTWTRTTIPIDPSYQAFQLNIPLVLPTRPDVIFVWVDTAEPITGHPSPDEILVSSDGGATWKTAFESTGDLPGLSLSPDGKTLLISGPEAGVVSASVDDVLTKGEAAFTKIYQDSVWGLVWTADGLYAGNNNLTARDLVTGIVPPAFTFGTSQDQGHSFSAIVDLCQITYGTCAAGSPMDKACKDRWAKSPVSGFHSEYAIQTGRCGGEDAGASASSNSSAAPPSNKSSGCSYAPSSTWNGGAEALAALLGVGLAVSRRRRAKKNIGSSN